MGPWPYGIIQRTNVKSTLNDAENVSTGSKIKGLFPKPM